MQLYHKNNDIEIVKDDYQPWENYKDGTEEKIILYYHPFQFLPIRRLTMGLAFTLDGKYFDDVTNVNESFATMKKFILGNLELNKKSHEDYWIPRLGLLILLDEAYGRPLVKGFKYSDYKDHNRY